MLIATINLTKEFTELTNIMVDGEAAANINLTIKQSSGEAFEVQVAPNATVLQLKEACTEKTQLPAASQRLIFKGK